MNLLIVSHTPHYRKGDDIVGWGPTVREIDQLTRLFSNIVHLAPLHEEPAPGSSLPYLSERVQFRPVQPAGGLTLRDKLGVMRQYWDYFQVLRQEIPRADVVHVRCPANISLLAILLLPLFKNPPVRWVKYAGNWRPEGREPLSYRLQRYWLKKGFSGGVVTVNGRWPGQQPHVHSFFNPSLTEQELDQARAACQQKKLALPLSLLFVGRVEEAKGVGRVLQVARELKESGVDFKLHLVGDGPERAGYEGWSREKGLENCVTFHGWLPRPELVHFYAEAHFLIFPSSSEGWPKVLSEAMAYGAVPLAGAVSTIPQILAATGAGMALPPLETSAFVAAIRHYQSHPGQWKAASRAGMEAASHFTYEFYWGQLEALFHKTWYLNFRH